MAGARCTGRVGGSTVIRSWFGATGMAQVERRPQALRHASEVA
jgi:hypothetical protein